MHPALTLALFALAVARTTRLVTDDRVTEAPRAWLVDRLWGRTLYDVIRKRSPLLTQAGVVKAARHEARFRRLGRADPPLGAYLITCPWCVSIWLGAVAAPLWYWWGSSPWLVVPAAWLAFSYVTGFLAGKEA